jgi:endogenous inhibitor of DNA gyrase (YacG/DUF329 family)
MSRRIRCPICHKSFLADLSDAMPFCSLRCKQIDAGRWLDEKYVLPDDLENEPEEEQEGETRRPGDEENTPFPADDS